MPALVDYHSTMFAKVHNIISKLSTMIGEYSNIIPSYRTKTFWRHRQLSNHDRQLPWYCRQLSITRRQLRSDVDNLGTMVVLWKLPIMVSKKNSDHGLGSPWCFVKVKGEYTLRMRVGVLELGRVGRFRHLLTTGLSHGSPCHGF